MALLPLCCPPLQAAWPPTAGRLRAARIAVAATAVTSGLALVYATAAGMVGSWSDIDVGALWAVVSDTHFGEVSAGRLVLAALALLLCLPPRATRPRLLALAVASGTLAASTAGTGHADDGAGLNRALHVGVDALHLLVAGAWLGGITALFILLVDVGALSPPRQVEAARTASAGFAGLGSLAVAGLLLTGLVNGWLLVGSPHAMVSTAYGRVLSVKLIFFAAMLLFAAVNRFVAVPRLRRSGTGAETARSFARLRRHILAEQLLGAAVILAVAFLGTMEPAIVAAPS